MLEKILRVLPWFLLQIYNKIGYYRVILIFMVFRKNLMEQGEIENFKFFAKKLIQINGPIIGGARGGGF